MSRKIIRPVGSAQRRLPQGVVVKHPIDLYRYMPSRIHYLSERVATPASVRLPDGVVIRAREWRVLASLGARGPLTNREISRMVAMDAATTTRAVQYLLSHGLVATKVSRTDRRKLLISLTPKGAEAHDHLAPERMAYARSLERGLTPEEREELYRIFDKIEARIVQLEEDADDDWME